MPLADSLVDFGLKMLHNKALMIGSGIAVGYAVTPDRFKPKHPIRTPLMFGAGLASGGGVFGSAMLAGGAVAGGLMGIPDDTYQSDMWNYMAKPMMGAALFPNGYMPEFQWGFSALSHENLSARYGGPNPNSDAALFTNNFDDTTGSYIGPTAGQSLGARSSALNLGANGSLVFGLWNNRLR